MTGDPGNGRLLGAQLIGAWGVKCQNASTYSQPQAAIGYGMMQRPGYAAGIGEDVLRLTSHAPRTFAAFVKEYAQIWPIESSQPQAF